VKYVGGWTLSPHDFHIRAHLGHEKHENVYNRNSGNCGLLGYSAASSGNFLPTFRDNPSSGVKMLTPEERSFHPLRGRSLKSRNRKFGSWLFTCYIRRLKCSLIEIFRNARVTYIQHVRSSVPRFKCCLHA